MAVKRITHFRAQRIAGTEAARFASVSFANFQNLVPNGLDRMIQPDDLEPIFPRVASPSHKEVAIVETNHRDLVLLQVSEAIYFRASKRSARNYLINKILHLWPLHRHRRVVIRSVAQF